MEHPKTIIISAYRDFSVRYILYSDILPSLLIGVDQVVILVKEQNIEYYRKQFPNPKIVVESVQYKECEKFLKKSTLGRQFTLLRKCFSAKQGHFINETDDSRIFIYKKELSRSSFLQRVLFSIVVRAAYVAPNHRWFRKLIVGVEGGSLSREKLRRIDQTVSIGSRNHIVFGLYD